MFDEKVLSDVGCILLAPISIGLPLAFICYIFKDGFWIGIFSTLFTALVWSCIIFLLKEKDRYFERKAKEKQEKEELKRKNKKDPTDPFFFYK